MRKIIQYHFKMISDWPDICLMFQESGIWTKKYHVIKTDDMLRQMTNVGEISGFVDPYNIYYEDNEDK